MSFRKITLLLSITLLLASCSRKQYVNLTGYAQGGEYSVKFCTSGLALPVSEVADSINAILTGIDFSLSGYNKESLLSKFNAGCGITPDRFFTEVLELSEKYREATDGAFDVTAGPLFDIWGFGFKTDSLPSEERIKEALELCRSGQVLNFNAIAQGYSCDVIAAYLHSLGVHDMLVNIGEIYCEGLNDRGTGWTIGIDNPIDGNNSPGADMRAKWTSDGKACGIVTSGNYRKYYIKDGRKYAHTIDPRTGYPVQHSLLSATVVASTAAEADALATACMVIGPEDAKDLILGTDGVEGFLIFEDGTWNSPGFHLYEE